MIALICHLVGDYLLQSDWMANNKTRSSWACAVHAVTYSLPFLFITRSPVTLAIIAGSHFIIDRWRLARLVVFAKNFIAPRSEWPRWEECSATGYHRDRPLWLATWLLIIADNTLHVIINTVALGGLP